MFGLSTGTAMEAAAVSVDDHCRLSVLIKFVGPVRPSPSNSARLIERLKRIQSLSVSDNPRRLLLPRILTSVNDAELAWADFQAHRRVLGLVAVGCAEEGADPTNLAEVGEQFGRLKGHYRQWLVAARCLLFGAAAADGAAVLTDVADGETICYESLEESADLENDVRELLRSIYWVLESRRLDNSFERVDSPHCPLVADEEKYRVGVENRASKTYRKKCVGRLKKQMADYCLLTGLPGTAVDVYTSAIDALKSTNDWLWLAGSYEGWACAAVALKYDIIQRRKPSMHRVSTFSPGELENYQNTDCDRVILLDSTPRVKLHRDEILERFRLALEHYEKYSFAASIEYECVLKVATVYRFEKQYCEMESFLRESTAKYLDDVYTQFDGAQKAAICKTLSRIYFDVGFKRKAAFFTRLAVLFHLHTTAELAQQDRDYRSVYPMLYTALPGYGVAIDDKHASNGSVKGWSVVQVRALHEVYVSALRAGYVDAAIRHLCFLLEVYLDEMDVPLIKQLYSELEGLCGRQAALHHTNSHLKLPCDIISPPLAMTRFPLVLSFDILPLEGHLSASVVEVEEVDSLFIYNPFKKPKGKARPYWVVGCTGVVSVYIENRLPFEFHLKNLTIYTDGVEFDAMPVHLSLPAWPSEPISVKLLGIPRTAGKLVVSGYGCEFLSIRNLCRCRDIALLSNCDAAKHSEIEVIPELPRLLLRCSLPRASLPTAAEAALPTTSRSLQRDEVASAETYVYSGQSFEHSLFLENGSQTTPINRIEVVQTQPKVHGGPRLIELLNVGCLDDGLATGEQRQLSFIVVGLDPMTTADDDDASDAYSRSTVGGLDGIPYTGRLVVASLTFRYEMTVEGVTYGRSATLSIYVTIMPAVTLSSWHLLPGDSSANRYIVLDVANNADAEAELRFADDKRISVEPKESCRVPLLCPCAPRSACTLDVPPPQQAHRRLALAEDKLRAEVEPHVSRYVDIHWRINSLDITGAVPIGPLLGSIAFLRQLVQPPLSFAFQINGQNLDGREEHTFGVGQLVSVELELTNTFTQGRYCGSIGLACFQDLQSKLQAVDRSDHVIFVGPVQMPFILSPSNADFSCRFGLLFCYEGVYKVKPACQLDENSDQLDGGDLFLPVLSFNIITKAQ